MASERKDNTLKILIAGGGIGGTAAAIALARAGAGVTVLERTDEADRSTSGLVLASNGMAALRAIRPELADDVIAGGAASGLGDTVEPESPFLTPRGRRLTGVSFTGMQHRYGEPVVSIEREALQRLLEQHARGAGVEFRRGVPVDAVDDRADRVTALDSDGGELTTGDVLIGADGLRSRVRAQLLADGPPEYRGFTAVRGFGPIAPEYPAGSIVYGNGLILFSSPIRRDTLYWVASIAAPEGEWPTKGTESAYRDLLGRLRNWHPSLAIPVRQATDLDRLIVTDIYDRDPVGGYARGRVALLGDAAHPMVYTMGQGANQALEDAAVLAHQVHHVGATPAALTAYVALRAPRVAKIVKQSRMFGSIGHARGPISTRARDTMMTIMGRLQRGDRPDPVMSWQPPG